MAEPPSVFPVDGPETRGFLGSYLGNSTPWAFDHAVEWLVLRVVCMGDFLGELKDIRQLIFSFLSRDSVGNASRFSLTRGGYQEMGWHHGCGVFTRCCTSCPEISSWSTRVFAATSFFRYQLFCRLVEIGANSIFCRCGFKLLPWDILLVWLFWPVFCRLIYSFIYLIPQRTILPPLLYHQHQVLWSCCQLLLFLVYSTTTCHAGLLQGILRKNCNINTRRDRQAGT